MKSKTLTESYYLRKLPQVLLKFVDCRTVPEPDNSPTGTSLRKGPRLTLPQWALPQPEFFPKEIPPIIMYYFNFPLSYIFVKSQVICRTQKVDFDLQPTSIIYTRWKADIIDDTEGLQTKILR